LKNLIYISLFLIIFFGINLKPSFAKENKPENLKIFAGKWIDKCSKKIEGQKKYCLLERGMFLDKKFEKRLVTMLLRTNENSKDALLTIISPLGTLIQSGVRISLDNEQLNEKAYGFIFCKKDGCFTSTIIKKEKIELFKKSKALKLEYTMDNQQTLNIGLDLKGFTKAFDKITKF
tara:strand:+ start:330 stop:857 length:528 start_codon:yes stop_codon:yes gene_type:complete